MDQKNIDDILAKVEERLGKGNTFILGNKTDNAVDTISTGVPSLDIALGGNGYPCGRVVEIFGPEASGKTTLALHAIATAQELGAVAGFVDAEHALDPCYAEVLGVDLNALLLHQPDCGEDGLNAVEAFIKSGVNIIVVDSVAALTPRAELDGEMGATHMGLQARLMGQALRKLTSLVSKNGVTLIFINQIRQKIGIVFGSPNVTTGGNALKFYASVRLDIRRISLLKNKDNEPYGNRTLIKVVKNKIATPFTETEVDLVWGIGIDKFYSILDAALDTGVIVRRGSWFSHNGEQIGQGREKVRQLLASDDGFSETVYAEIRAAHG